MTENSVPVFATLLLALISGVWCCAWGLHRIADSIREYLRRGS